MKPSEMIPMISFRSTINAIIGSTTIFYDTLTIEALYLLIYKTRTVTFNFISFN